MFLEKFIAGQLRKPSGVFGRFILLRLLNEGNARINTLALETLELQSDDIVLEIGFGGGYLIEKMSGIVTTGQIAGVDFSEDSVQFCRNKFGALIQTGRIDLTCANVDALPYPAETFTKTCTVNTIYFWADPLASLGEIRRVLKKNGTLSVCFSTRNIMEKMAVTRHGFTLYDAGEVRSLLLTAGYRDVRLIFGKGRVGDCVAAIGTSS